MLELAIAECLFVPDNCIGGYCSPRSVQSLGGKCALDAECADGIDCSRNVCGGPDATCKANGQCTASRE